MRAPNFAAVIPSDKIAARCLEDDGYIQLIDLWSSTYRLGRAADLDAQPIDHPRGAPRTVPLGVQGLKPE